MTGPECPHAVPRFLPVAGSPERKFPVSSSCDIENVMNFGIFFPPIDLVDIHILTVPYWIGHFTSPCHPIS